MPDPRDARGRMHPLVAVLGLTGIALIAGCTSLGAVAPFHPPRPADTPVKVLTIRVSGVQSELGCSPGDEVTRRISREIARWAGGG